MKKKTNNPSDFKTTLSSSIKKRTHKALKLNYSLKNKSSIEIELLVHRLRVALKRMRALWFLLEPYISKTQYQREKKKIVNASKALGVSRDEAIKKVTVKTLLSQVDNMDDRFIMANIFKIIQRRPIPYSPRSILKAKKTVEQSLLSFKRVKLADADPDHLKLKLIKCLNKSSEMIKITSANQNDRNLHKLRIISKKFLYANELLKPFFKKKFYKKIKKLDALQYKLGLVHDIAVTSQFILAHKEYFDCPKSKARFIKCINKRKKYLTTKSMLLAKKLFLNKHAILQNEIAKLRIE